MKHLRFPAWALLAGMASMLLLFVLLPAQEYSSTERRYLADAPEATLESLLDRELGEDVEGYLADHFPGRNFFVGVNAYWNLLTGRNTAGSVYYGKQGYLIRPPESCPTEQLEKNLSRFNEFAASTGLPATLLMVPAAGDVLEDKLPDNHAPYRYKECLALAQDICGSMRVTDLEEPLEKASETAQVYYKTDHHLTSEGCYAVYGAFCEAQGREALPPDAYTVTSFDGFHGTTWTSSGYWLTAPEPLEIWDSGTEFSVTISEKGKDDVIADSVFFLQNLQSDDMYTVFLDGNHAQVHIHNPSADGGSLLVLRDSYGHCTAPFIAEDYRDVILIDLRYYRDSLLPLIKEYGVTELAVLYGLDSMLTDTNSAWLG